MPPEKKTINEAELEQKTAKGLKEFRHKNWDSSLSKEEAYKKYMDVKEWN